MTTRILLTTVPLGIAGLMLCLTACPPAEELADGGENAVVEAAVDAGPIAFVRRAVDGEVPAAVEEAKAETEAVAETETEAVAETGRIPAQEPAPVTATYPVGTAGTDVREMLKAVEAGTRADIPIPEAFGDLAIQVQTRWIDVADLDGDGVADKVLERTATVPHEYEPTQRAAWLVAVLSAADGTVGPDQEKAGILIDAGVTGAEQAPLRFVESVPGEQAVVRYDRWNGEGYAPWQAEAKPTAEVTEPDLDRDVALIQSAMAVYDAGVLAPEMAYVKAFIRKEFLPEVEAVETTRDLMFPEVLRPLYTSLKLVEQRSKDEAVAATYAADEGRFPIMIGILAKEADLRLSLSADELRRRVAGLQELGEIFEGLEEGLELDGEKARRRDFEIKLGETADAETRAAVTKTYQDQFRPMIAADGRYQQFIAEMNEIARAHGYANYADMRMVEKFGMDLDGFMGWVDQTWQATDADAKAYIASLEQFAGAESLTYWQVKQLSDAWILDQVGMEALPKLSEEDAVAIMQRMFKDVGFDMAADPYDRITMDWYQDDLKWNRAGTAASANPQQAYFTSNLKPGAPIPLDEWQTPVHETAHTLHYQTSGATAPGLSSYQNNMPSYVAEGVAMTFETVPVANETLMRRYFEGKDGFTDKLFSVYPDVTRQAAAWETRRLLNMAMYEINLYMDQDKDGNARSWEDRTGAWPQMVRDNLFVEPPEDALAQIMCRSHPFNDQSQLGYASYGLGFALVNQIGLKVIVEGNDEELKRFGEAMHQVMADGAVANRDSVQAVVDTL